MLRAKQRTLAVGKGAKFYCTACSTVFEIVHEPEYQHPRDAASFGGKPKQLSCCPFCEEGTATMDIR